VAVWLTDTPVVGESATGCAEVEAGRLEEASVAVGVLDMEPVESITVPDVADTGELELVDVIS